MAKKSNLVKNLGLACAIGTSVTCFGLGATSFVDFAKTDFTGIKNQTSATIIEQVNLLPFKIASYSREHWAIDGYSGTDKTVTLPETFSFGPKVDKTHIFEDQMDLQNWQETFEAILSYENAPNNPDWSMEHYEDELFVLNFTDANGDVFTARSLYQIHSNLREAVFPLTLTYQEAQIIEGTDCKITMVNQINDEVVNVNIPENLYYAYDDGSVFDGCIDFDRLGKKVTNVNIAEGNPLGEVRAVQNGFVIDLEGNRIINILPSAITSSTLTLPSEINGYEIDYVHWNYMYALENNIEAGQQIEKIVFEDGISSFYGQTYSTIGTNNLTLEFSASLEKLSINLQQLLSYRDVCEDGQFSQGDNYKYNNKTRDSITLILKSVPISDVNGNKLSWGSEVEFANNPEIISIYVEDSIYDEFISSINWYNSLNNRVFRLSTLN